MKVGICDRKTPRPVEKEGQEVLHAGAENPVKAMVRQLCPCSPRGNRDPPAAVEDPTQNSVDAQSRLWSCGKLH